MSTPLIPYDDWQPLTVSAVVNLFTGAPFEWALAGGYALEQFLGSSYRDHADIDIILFRDQQTTAYQWLKDWCLYVADSGTLRRWLPDEILPPGLHDIWCHQLTGTSWQLQLMVIEVEDGDWVYRRQPAIREPRLTLITTYRSIPCIRAEVQLLYKSKQPRPRDEVDFDQCLPHLTPTRRQWLKDNLWIVYPDGHHWLDCL